jgi:N,N'-diacetyllegionaminate synthase
MNKVNIIAEVGSSHMRDKGRALELIALAASAGADTVKFQLFTADELWDKSSQNHAGTVRAELPPEWLGDLMDACAKHKVKFLCTPFSLPAVELLEYHQVEAYKIASGDLTYLPLIEAIGKTGNLSSCRSAGERSRKSTRPSSCCRITKWSCCTASPATPQPRTRPISATF